MSKLNNIPIKNIFHMLSYAYKTIKIEDIKSIGTEKFKNMTNLYTEVLIISVSKIVKRGMWKEYNEIQENSSYIKGKVNLKDTFSMTNTMKHKVAVQYEILTENNLLNQILKSVILSLMTHASVSRRQKKRLRNLIIYFSEVETITLNIDTWKNINYTNQNNFYNLPIDLSRYLYQEMLLTEENISKTQQIHDEQKLSSLFEKFIFNFYQKESNYKVSSPQIYWDVDDGYLGSLPIMKTDIVLKKENRTLIIDTKFYQDNMRKSHEKSSSKHISEHLYQIFSYLENYKKLEAEKVNGLLLYAKTQSEDQPAHNYSIKGKNIGAQTIDLGKDFNIIRNELIQLAHENLN